MKPFPSRSLLSIVVASALAGVLVLLAVLQFDWVGKVAQAEKEHMEADLDTGIGRFRWDFYTQLLHVCSAFQLGPRELESSSLQPYAERYEDWANASTRPRLVSGLYIWKARNPSGRRLFRLNPATRKFENAAWPAAFETLRFHLGHDPAKFLRHSVVDKWSRRWGLVEQVPALVRGFWTSQPHDSGNAGGTGLEGCAIIMLDMKYMQSALFPLLRERYFRGPRGLMYRVSIISQSSPRAVIYESGPRPVMSTGSPPDAVVDLVPWRPGFLVNPLADQLPAASGLDRANDPLVQYFRRQLANQRAPIVMLAGPKVDWKVVARHRSGSVQAAVMELRDRDLAVSLGVLIILAVSIGLIVVFAQRAQRLAKIQMDFVAGISHELRTPLAVICSAADNLADGVVASGNQIKEYGALVRNEGRHLAEMVEQILGFAAQQVGRPSEDRTMPVEIAEVIDAALVQAGLTLKDSDIKVETRIEAGLPAVLGDAAALIRCLRNLLVNAMKYGGDSRWVRISARSCHSRRRLEIEIVVEDRGIGIDPADLPHIFEPFYRGRSREVAHIRGTGLGLSLAKDIAEAMGGFLSVKSALGRGSSFIVRLPAFTAVESPSVAKESPLAPLRGAGIR
jgi:signal transduction histidine kinase